MPNEGIQGDEWDAYVTLLVLQGRTWDRPRDASPVGDGGLVVVVGVTPDQGGRESRPQGEGTQVSGRT